MGREKEEWMRQQELEPMHDWIEENFGDVAGEKGSYDWGVAVLAYQNYCENLAREEAELHWREELEWYLHAESPLAIFVGEMHSVEELLTVQASDSSRYSLFVMLHAHVVAAVESYLASTFIHAVTNSEELIRKLVETDPKFSDMKFTIKEIYQKSEGLKLIVAQYLKDLIFHDLKKVKPMFREVLGCDFGDIKWLFSAIIIRHHCVHRAGQDKDGNRVEISYESIKSLIASSSLLINKIEACVSESHS